MPLIAIREILRRDNSEGTLLASASRESTAATNSDAQTNYNARGVVVTVSFSVGTTSTAAAITPSIAYKEFTGSNYVTIAALPASTGTGRHVLVVYPGASTSNLSTASAVQATVVPIPLPRTWRFTNAASTISTGTTQITWSAAYCYVL